MSFRDFPFFECLLIVKNFFMIDFYRKEFIIYGEIKKTEKLASKINKILDLRIKMIKIIWSFCTFIILSFLFIFDHQVYKQLKKQREDWNAEPECYAVYINIMKGKIT